MSILTDSVPLLKSQNIKNKNFLFVFKPKIESKRLSEGVYKRSDKPNALINGQNPAAVTYSMIEIKKMVITNENRFILCMF